MNFIIKDRMIDTENKERLISYNKDYIAHFDFDEEWDGTIKTARFIQDGKHEEKVLIGDTCKIPVLKKGYVRVGVFNDTMTSTYVILKVSASIKDDAGNPAEPEPDVYAQLISMIEAGMVKGEDGYTPIKGTDYFTDEEVEEIIGWADVFSQEAEKSAAAAAASERNAALSEQAAKESAEQSAEAASAADTSKKSADEAAKAAKASEDNAAVSEKAAEESKTAAADSAVAAEKSKTDAETLVNTLSDDFTEMLADVADLKISKANKSDLDKTADSLNALWKLNRGQTWDTQEAESNAYTVDVPSGSHYASVDMIGGKSIVWNQLVDHNSFEQTVIRADVTWTNNGDGSITANGSASGSTYIILTENPNTNMVVGHKYLVTGIKGGTPDTYRIRIFSGYWDCYEPTIFTLTQEAYDNDGDMLISTTTGATVNNVTFKPQIFDLTQMFGSGNEPTVEEFEAMFPGDYYPYCEPTIISSQTDRVDVRGKNLFDVNNANVVDGYIAGETGFPELNSAGEIYDYIDLNERKLHRRVGVVDLGSGNFIWAKNSSSANFPFFYAEIKPIIGSLFKPAVLCTKYLTCEGSYSSLKDMEACTYFNINFNFVRLAFRNDLLSDVTADEFRSTLNGVMLHYELAEEIVTDIELPAELADWLEVEAGGSITFHNADEGKKLLVPNKETFIRKLDEVTA